MEWFVCLSAALNGHFEILKWAREQGCEWNSNVCYNAAYYGHIEILKWAREQGCEWNKNLCYELAKDHGYTEITKWIEEND